MSFKKIVVGLLVVVALFSCNKDERKQSVTRLPYFNSAEFTPEWGAPKHKIPDFTFVNQDGEIVSNKTFVNKIYIADFFFTSCPGICPKLTKNMGRLQEAYLNDDDVQLLSHTVMPWKDSISVLKKYAEEHQVNPAKWNLVTGDKEALYHIARHGYFADEDFIKTQDDSRFIHTENFILVDKKGYIRGVYNGTLEMDIERLKRHIDILKNDK